MTIETTIVNRNKRSKFETVRKIVRVKSKKLIRKVKSMTNEDWWNIFQMVGIGLVALTFTVAAIGFVLGYKTRQEKDKKAQESRERIAQLTKDAESLRAEAAKTNESVTNATLEIANAKVETEKAKAEAAKATEGLAKSNKEIALLTLETEKAKTERAEADKQIAIAKTEAAKANTETAKLNFKVEEEGLKRAKAEARLLELQNKFLWRYLDVKKFVDLLKTGAKGKAEIIYLKDDDEAYNFATNIWQGLEAAGWSAPQPKAAINIKEGDSDESFSMRESGIMVGNRPVLTVTVGGELANFPYVGNSTPVDALMSAFNACGFDPVHNGSRNPSKIPSGMIRIVVGSRL